MKKHTIATMVSIAIALCTACGSQDKGCDDSDSVRSRREAFAEWKRLSKRNELRPLAPSVYARVLRKGNGPIPNDSSTVTVHYEGRLANGHIFDSSYERGEAWTTTIDNVIRGWKDALKQMPCGSKWLVYILSEKAYGEESVGGIPPYSNLYFTIELIDVQNK